MKKILLTMAIFAIVGSMLFAQNASISASNELSSNTITKPAGKGNPASFAGFQESASATIETETWKAQTSLTQKLYSLSKTINAAGPSSGTAPAGLSVNGDNWENVKYEESGWTSNFWYRPLAGIELGVGNDFGNAVPAGNMVGIGEQMGYLINETIAGSWSAGSKWAKDGFLFNFTKVPGLTAGINIPFHGIVDEYDFAPALNAGADYSFNDKVNLGVTYHGGSRRDIGHVFGLYGQFKNDTVRVPLGVTFGLKTAQFNKGDDDAMRMQIDFAPDFTFRNGMSLGVSASAKMSFTGNDLFPIAFGLYYAWPINNAWKFDVRAKFTLYLDASADPTWSLNPKVTYTINPHNSVYVGVGLDGVIGTGIGYKVPIGWVWTL